MLKLFTRGSYGLAAARETLGGPGANLPGQPPLALCMGVALGFALVMLGISTVLVHREAKS